MDLGILLQEDWQKKQQSTGDCTPSQQSAGLVSTAFSCLLNESIHMPEHPLYIGIIANVIS